MSNFAKKIPLFLILMVFFFPIAIHAKELKNGMQFLVARNLLIYEKWRPINVHDGDDYEYIGTENELINAHIKEVESCAIDKPLCIFNYKKKDVCLRLFTQGEKIKDMRVNSWAYECPNRN